MKGLSTTIILVITVVVILVAALVVLTIFGQGIQNVTTITQAESLCLSSAQISCSASGGTTMPSTWNIPNVRIAGGIPQSCAQVFSTKTCATCANVASGCTT